MGGMHGPLWAKLTMDQLVEDNAELRAALDRAIKIGRMGYHASIPDADMQELRDMAKKYTES